MWRRLYCSCGWVSSTATWLPRASTTSPPAPTQSTPSSSSVSLTLASPPAPLSTGRHCVHVLCSLVAAGSFLFSIWLRRLFTIVHGFRPEFENFDFGKKGYHRKEEQNCANFSSVAPSSEELIMSAQINVACSYMYIHTSCTSHVCLRISLVDLAGAERTGKTGATGVRVKEAGNINNSLLTLGKCVEAMKYNQNKK